MCMRVSVEVLLRTPGQDNQTTKSTTNKMLFVDIDVDNQLTKITTNKMLDFVMAVLGPI